MSDESLLSGSTVLLFGKVLQDITLNHRVYNRRGTPPRRGVNKLLQDPLAYGPDSDPHVRPEDASLLARIYGFSHQGQYFELAPPAIFLVHGIGDDPEALRPFDQQDSARQFTQGSTILDKAGVALQLGHFAQDVRVWSYDKSDFSLRLDEASGMLEQILLQAELDSDGDYPQFGGGKVGGGKVGGGKVGGGKVGGGKVGGGKVGGG
jgi:hypothetical protein